MTKKKQNQIADLPSVLVIPFLHILCIAFLVDYNVKSYHKGSFFGSSLFDAFLHLSVFK